MAVPFPPDELQRLEAVRRYSEAATPHDPRFDRLTRLAAWIFGVPIALVTLIDEGWQHLHSCYGIDETGGAPRELAFCNYTILSDEVLVVEDAARDEHFADHPMVTGSPRIRFYAGAPLLSEDGHRLGTLCLVDMVPHTFTDEQRARLQDLAALVVDEFELNREIRERQQVEQALRASEAHFRALNEHALDIVAILSPDAALTYVTPSVDNTLGYSVGDLAGTAIMEHLHPDDVAQARTALQACLERPDEPQHLEVRFRHRDGSWRWLSVKARNLLDHGGVEGILLNASDVTERCEAEQALRRAKTKYETLFTTANDPILIFEPEGEVILEANPQACAFYGYERDELIGTSLRTLSQDPEARRADVEHTLEDGCIQNLETVQLRRDGTPVHVLVSARRIDYDGRTAILSINRDVGARRAAREALQHSEDKFRSLVEQTNDWIWEIDTQSRFTYASPQAERIVGYAPDELLGRTTSDLMEEAEADRFARELNAYTEDHLPFVGLKKKLRHRDGHQVVLETSGTPIVDAAGTPRGYRGIARDVTERERREEQLRLLQSVVVHANDAVVITEAEPIGAPGPRIVYVNEAFCRNTGYVPEEVIGQTPRLLQGPLTDRAALDEVRRALERWQPVRVEVENYRKDGTTFWIEMVIVPVADETGWYTHWVSIQRDITERRRAMEALQQTLERERELSELKSRFVSMASHELRTPLAIIQSSAELIERFRARWEKEKVDKHLRRILNNVQDMTTLLEDVLLLGRTGSDGLPFEPERMSLRPFVDNLIDEMQSSLGARHRLVFDASEGEVDAVVDQTLLRLVLNNLLTNAVKYSPDDTTVRVRLRRDGEDVVLEVEDAGIGIPAADQERLFEPFHRASNVGARRGTGLGLSIVRRAVDMHGGHVSLQSRVDQGTTFFVRLPLKQPATPAPDEQLAADA